MTGYTRNYVTDFSGTSLPTGWGAYEGQPGGDPGAQFGLAHVSVGGGVLSVNTFKDPAYNNKWVTGGLCNCATGQTYGAWYVRSRSTGAGPTTVLLMWPDAPVWPPEIDFNETAGGISGTTATVHFGAANHQEARATNIDMTQWHTWGVIWTSTSITYTVDGRVWGTVSNASEIPDQPMHLSIQQQTWCDSGWACPRAPQSLLVDWVAQYAAN